MSPELRVETVRGRGALLASILGSGMAFLDGTAVNLALPAIGDDLGTGFAGFQWIVNGYMLTFASLVLIGGALGDRFGPRRVFELGVVVFGAMSAACGLVPGTLGLIVTRLAQGVGAALLVPNSLALVQASFVPGDRSRAIGTWSGLSGLATLLGPLLGGWLIATVSWRAIFLINPVIALGTLWATRRFVPPCVPTSREPIDVAGSVTAALGLGGIVYALIEGPHQGWPPEAVGAGAAGLALLAAFLLVERRAAHPMLPLRYFRIRAFAGANATTLIVYAVLSGVFFLLGLQLQRVVGYSPLAAGASTLPITAMLFFLSPRAGRLAGRIGPRVPMTLGPIVAACGVALFSRVGAGASYLTEVFPGILVFGLGLGLTVAPLTSAAMGALPDGHAGTASGVNNAVARLAALLAVTLLPLAAGLSGIGTVGGSAFSDGFVRAMWIGAVSMAMGGVVAWLTVPPRTT
ncbi:MAG TPA: MFS transporter [Candidatus Polarisedimenticolaceae bacterium]|nr:MFS transporter [Candidatus Polarisedimenticolaceae bacterium]